MNNAKGCLEAAAAVTAESGVDGVPEEPADEPTSTRGPLSRQPLPAALLRETVRIAPAETACTVCGGALAALGETVTEQLDIINNAFKVIETIRPKLACRRKCDAIVQAPLPAKPIERRYASPGLLSRILVSKYVEHILLYRECEIYARHGLVLNRNTLVRWVLELADKLSPLAVALNRYVLEAGKVHADDTPVQAPGSGRTRTGRLWVYVRDDHDRNTWSLMSPAVCGLRTRLTARVPTHSGTWRNTGACCRRMRMAVMTRCTKPVGCWCIALPGARAAKNLRRACPPADRADDRGAQADSCAVCHRGRYPGQAGGNATGDQKREKPTTDAESLYGWIQEQLKTLSVHVEMAKAFGYMLKQWDALNMFCGVARVEIDNNHLRKCLTVCDAGPA